MIQDKNTVGHTFEISQVQVRQNLEGQRQKMYEFEEDLGWKLMSRHNFFLRDI